MKTIRFAAFLLYRYYSKGSTRNISYFSTIAALTFAMYMHFFQILILTDQVEKFIPLKSSDNKAYKYFVMFLVMAPMYLLVHIIIPKRKLLVTNFKVEKVRKGYVFLILYGVLSFSLIFVLAILKA
jgi:hypothetical protein